MSEENETEESKTEEIKKEVDKLKSETFQWKIDGQWNKMPKLINGVDIENVLKKTIDRSDVEKSEIEGKFNNQLLELKTMVDSKDINISELNEKLEELQTQNLSAEEKAKLLSEKEIKKSQKELEILKADKDKFENMFMENRISRDIMDAVDKHDVANTGQAMRELRAASRTMLELDEHDNYNTVVKMVIDNEEVVMTPIEACKVFFALPHNWNLLNNALMPGGGTGQNGTIVNGSEQYNLSDWQMKISDSTPKERQALLRKKAAGEITIKT